MLALIFMYLMSISWAEQPELKADKTIIVEAHKDFEVYVAPIVMDIQSKEVEAVVAKKTVFSYTSRYWRSAKVKNERGAYETIASHAKVNVYDKDTISYIWDNCDYLIDPKKCAFKNNHMLLETIITVDDHQIVINMILYDSDLTVLGTSVYSSDSRIHWIRQQEVTVSQQQGLMGSSTVIHKPKEELPLKWLIPTNLLDKHIWQASVLLWSGIKLN
tara:strand:+ start:1149 stop:1799 length:651 start_codon:yes stop_codon:yes gene_type:complete